MRLLHETRKFEGAAVPEVIKNVTIPKFKNGRSSSFKQTQKVAARFYV